MKTGDVASVKRTFLSKERGTLSEERTVLAYINTELTFLGVVAVILKLYFASAEWTIYVTAGLFVFVGAIVFSEVRKIKKIRLKRQKIEKEEKGLRV
ncbi:DUF202 domain-containing protein [Candidatus Pacearchaeota archaeon]|nr:hypothetical protein [uncultured archaeon]MBS3077729.1 DUF202 domain-containing protein [Candidatus Pacearchaeota archaeon]